MSHFLVRSPKDGELLGLKWDMVPQVSEIIFPYQNFVLQLSTIQSAGQNDYILQVKELENSSNSLLDHV